MAVQNLDFTPTGYIPGQGGNGTSVPSDVKFTEMYAYTPAGLTSGKRLQVQETFNWYVNNNPVQSTQTMNLDGTWTYDTEGKVATVTYPTTQVWNGSQWNTTTGPIYAYSLDAMYRPSGLTENNNTVVSNVSYNPANQLLGITYFGATETRGYNSLNQMTTLTQGSATITYTFPAGTNNGKISQQMNSVSGETVTYQYDSLNRLASASGSGWSESYMYDGFGNLQKKIGTGSAPTLSQTVDELTNRIVGQNYDQNGNQTSGINGTLTYDAENRIVSGSGVQYAYDSRNKRIWSATITNNVMTQQIYYYGVDGQKLGTYQVAMGSNGPGVLMGDSPATLAVFFGGKRVGLKTGGSTTAFTTDRLGSSGSYYPYGEARGTVPQDAVGFATYTNDSATGLQYADQRYYASNFGRFLTADPYKANNDTPGQPVSPATWNRYAYVLNDPVNLYDPAGLFACRGDGEDQYYFGGAICGGVYGGGDPAPPRPFSDSGPLAQAGPSGSDSRFIRVRRYTTTSRQALAVQNDLRWLQGAIAQHSDCANWLAGFNSAINYMLDEPGTGATMMAVGVGAFSTTDNAVAGSAQTDLSVGALITINVNGAFFNSGPSSFVGYGVPSWITGGTDAAQTEILLHELGP